VRPKVPGVILDAGVLRTARTSVYVRTIIRVHARAGRPIVVPSTALVLACASGDIEAAELDPPEITVTALTQTIAPAVALPTCPPDHSPFAQVNPGTGAVVTRPERRTCGR
jgi:hypothetical protein